jgi:hypothetical protein
VEGRSPEIKRKYLSSLEVRKSLSKNEIPDSAQIMESLGEKLLMKLNKQRNKFFRRQIDHLNHQRYKNEYFNVSPPKVAGSSAG